MRQKRNVNNERPAQIQLELPDYSYAYEEWKRKQQNDTKQENSSVIIIENF